MLHETKFPLVTSASPVTRVLLLNDTRIGHDRSRGRTARVDENISATAAISPHPATLAETERYRRAVPRRVRLRHRTTPRRRPHSADAAALRRIGLPLGLREIYLASKDGYQDSVLPTGQLAGSPEDALDTACGLHLGDPTAWT